MRYTIFVGVVLAVLALPARTLAQFSFQGQIREAGAPVSGVYDLRFAMYASSSGGVPMGTICSDNVTVTDGLFTVILNFGNFDGSPRFIEIAVRPDAGQGCTDNSGFTILGPRQQVLYTPMASFALQANAATTATSATSALSATNSTQLNGQGPTFYTNASNLSSGTIPSARFGGTYSNALSMTNASNTFGGTGTLLTGLNASNLASGTVADARLPTNLLRTDASTSILSGNLRVAAFSSATVSGPPQFQIGPIGSDTGQLAFIRPASGLTIIGVRPGGTVADGLLSVLVKDTDVNGSNILAIGRATNDQFSQSSTMIVVQDDGRVTLGGTSTPGGGKLKIPFTSGGSTPHVDLQQTGGSGGFARLAFSYVSNDRSWIVASRTSEADLVTDRLNFFHNGGATPGAGNVLSIAGGAGGGSGRAGINVGDPIATLHVVGNVHIQGTGQDISVPTNETLQVGHFDGTTFTPRLFINTAGNATFTGDVAAATVTRWENVIAADFHAVHRMRHSTNTPVFLTQEGGVGANASAGISLPHGAVVTALRARVVDSSPDANVRVTLRRIAYQNTSGASFETVAEVFSSGVSGGSITIQTSAVSNSVINNENYVYEISVGIGDIIVTGDVYFYRATVEYTTPASLR